jgi:hypothetical protein
MRWLTLMLAAAAVLLAGAIEASAQGDRFVGVRKDSADEVILFAIEPFTGVERKIATLQKAEAGVQLLGMTALNSRRGTFSYAYTDRAAGKDYLHTVSVVTGETVARVPLPPDTSGLEVAADTGKAAAQVDTDAFRRRLEWLEQEVRRLQSQVRPR